MGEGLCFLLLIHFQYLPRVVPGMKLILYGQRKTESGEHKNKQHLNGKYGACFSHMKQSPVPISSAQIFLSLRTTAMMTTTTTDTSKLTSGRLMKWQSIIFPVFPSQIAQNEPRNEPTCDRAQNSFPKSPPGPGERGALPRIILLTRRFVAKFFLATTKWCYLVMYMLSFHDDVVRRFICLCLLSAYGCAFPQWGIGPLFLGSSVGMIMMSSSHILTALQDVGKSFLSVNPLFVTGHTKKRNYWHGMACVIA